MGIRGFVLGVALLAAVGWCMVQESIRQTQARYELAELIRREDDMLKRLERLRTEEGTLRSPARLAALVRERKMDLVALGSREPRARGDGAAIRAPGGILDDGYPGPAMASAP